MNLGLFPDSPILEMMVVVLLTVAILAAWRTVGRLRKASSGVDPLAEAEVYIAYGRKEQAVAILKEAIEAYPDRRREIEAKLRELEGSPAPANPVTKM